MEAPRGQRRAREVTSFLLFSCEIVILVSFIFRTSCIDLQVRRVVDHTLWSPLTSITNNMDPKDEKFAGAEDVDLKDIASAGDREIDPDLEKRILRKLDHHILPWIFILWLLAFIDRSNIGMTLQHDSQPFLATSYSLVRNNDPELC